MTPIKQIAKWIEDKPVWWRHAVRLALRHGELKTVHSDVILRIARMSHGLDPETDELIDASEPLDLSGYTQENSVVNLVSLFDVKGVGVLADDQELKFNNNGLYIVYGDNGSGKSSYVSVLKNACLTRGDCPEVLGSVFEASPPKPSAKIKFTANGEPEVFVWEPGSPGGENIKAVRVFDGCSAYHYINKEDSLGFKPAGLNLLTELTRVINQVKSIVAEDLMPGNGFSAIEKLSSTSSASEFVNNLSAESDESQLDSHMGLPTDRSKIEPLRKEILKDKEQTAETKKAMLVQQQELLMPLYNHTVDLLRYLGDKAHARLLELHLDYSEKQKQANEVKKNTLLDLPLETVAGVSWQAMWSAAEKFLEQEPLSANFPPVEGDACPFCLQEISSLSDARLMALKKYLSDSAATEAKEALKLIDSAIDMISAKVVSLADYKAALIELEKLMPDSAKKFEELFEVLSERKPLFLSKSSLPKEIDPLDICMVDDLKMLIDSLASQRESIKSDADFSTLIKAKEAELQNLIDRNFVLQNSEAIKQNILRYKTIKKLRSLERECNTRPVSDLSSTINQESTVKPLVKAFSDELKQFGFIRFSVKAKSRNKSGSQQFKLEIEEVGQSVSSIASEGEQCCIAIAAFLAELKADNRKSAVIFDDPVDSLSHQWRSRVASRLVSESKARQVVIFTHDIVFYKLLLEEAESQNAKHDSSALERSRKNLAGIVRESAPWEALTTSKRIKALNTELKELRQIDKAGTDAEFRRASREFYGKLRESWERLVEEKLLNKVVNRFERGVQTQRLRRLTDITDTDISTIDDAMTKCSTYFTGHDSAPAVGDPYPTIDEIEGDLTNITEYLKELQGNQRKRT